MLYLSLVVYHQIIYIFACLIMYHKHISGNRMCSLQQTSERALFLFFANIIRQFKFMTSSEGETVDLAGESELLSLTLKPKPLHVKIAKVA